MDIITKYRLFFWSTVSLVVLNLILVGLLWVEPSAPPPPEAGPAGLPDMRIERFLQRELGLTDNQQRQLQQLRDDHRNETRDLMQEQGRIQSELLENIAAGNDAVVDSLSHRFGELHAASNRATYDHFQNIRELCDDRQKEIFDEIVQRATNRFRQGRPPGRPR